MSGRFKVKPKNIGKLKPRYSLILNQYADFRASKCIKCDKPTFLRKFALLIHVDGGELITLGKTCRYCAKCELIVVHQDELEADLPAKLKF
jgi:MinD superfamily P-loop ATPase